jgi:hypothetical protein
MFPLVPTTRVFFCRIRSRAEAGAAVLVVVVWAHPNRKKINRVNVTMNFVLDMGYLPL